jgi:hypothetical protein
MEPCRAVFWMVLPAMAETLRKLHGIELRRR